MHLSLGFSFSHIKTIGVGMEFGACRSGGYESGLAFSHVAYLMHALAFYHFYLHCIQLKTSSMIQEASRKYNKPFIKSLDLYRTMEQTTERLSLYPIFLNSQPPFRTRVRPKPYLSALPEDCRKSTIRESEMDKSVIAEKRNNLDKRQNQRNICTPRTRPTKEC